MVMRPSRRLWSSTTGNATRSYFFITCTTSSSGSSTLTVRVSSSRNRSPMVLRALVAVQKEPLQGQPAEQLSCGVDHVDAVEGLDLFRLLAHFADGLGDRPVHFDTDELRAHEGAGGAFRVAQQGQQVLAVLRVQLGDDLFGPLLRQFADHVGRVIRIDVLEDLLGDFLVGQGGEQRFSDVLLQLDEHVSPFLDIDQFPEVLDLLVLEAVEDLGDVGRVQFLEPGAEFVIPTLGDVLAQGLQVVARDVLHGAKVARPLSFSAGGGRRT